MAKSLTQDPTADQPTTDQTTADQVTDQPTAAPAKAPKPDETIPGGRYMTSDGRMVNANGQEIESDGTIKAGQAPVPAVLLPNAPAVQ